jgi:hypothetical protein
MLWCGPLTKLRWALLGPMKGAAAYRECCREPEGAKPNGPEGPPN